MTPTMWIALLGTFLVAVMSPGPDFLAVLRISLSSNRRAGRMGAAGIAAGTVLWIIATMVGIVALINSHPTTSLIIRLIGAGFLTAYGAHIVLTTLRSGPEDPQATDLAAPSHYSPARAFRLGLLTTTVGNPKAVVFYTAFFATLLPPGMGISESLLLGIAMVLISFSWFAFVATVASNRAFIRGYERLHRPIDIILGALFIALGIALFPWSRLF
ncbi:MAG: LysE family translocator [Actinomycetaceae bacterium]|nr:LysE family translocator [Actinomycetaceae bacterium]